MFKIIIIVCSFVVALNFVVSAIENEVKPGSFPFMVKFPLR